MNEIHKLAKSLDATKCGIKLLALYLNSHEALPLKEDALRIKYSELDSETTCPTCAHRMFDK